MLSLISSSVGQYKKARIKSSFLIASIFCLLASGCSFNPFTSSNQRIEKIERIEREDKTLRTGEFVSQFLINEEKSSLAIIGERNHFMLPLDNNLQEVFKWPSKYKIETKIQDAESTGSDSISVSYNATVHKSKITSLTRSESKFLRAHKFKETKKSFTFKQIISGIYYKSNSVNLDYLTPFKLQYFLNYRRAESMQANNKSTLEDTTELFFSGIKMKPIPLMRAEAVFSMPQ